MLILKVLLFIVLLITGALVIRYKLYPSWRSFFDDLVALITLDFLPGPMRVLVGVGLVVWGAAWLVTRFTGDLRTTGAVAQTAPAPSLADLAQAASLGPSEEAGGEEDAPPPPPSPAPPSGEVPSGTAGAPQDGGPQIPPPDPSGTPAIPTPAPGAEQTPAPVDQTPKPGPLPQPSPIPSPTPKPSPTPETVKAPAPTVPTKSPEPTPTSTPTPDTFRAEAATSESLVAKIPADSPPRRESALESRAATGIVAVSSSNGGNLDASPAPSVYYRVTKQNGKTFIGRLTGERQGKYYFEKPNGDFVALPTSQIQEIRPHNAQNDW